MSPCPVRPKKCVVSRPSPANVRLSAESASKPGVLAVPVDVESGHAWGREQGQERLP